MYNNPYMTAYTPQLTKEKLDESITRLQQMRDQLNQTVQPTLPTNLTQNFSLSPAPQNGMRYANSLDEVSKEMVYADTPFFSKDLSVVWVKNAKGEIKSYELNEIVQKDDKDLQIEYLTAQLNEMNKGMEAMNKKIKEMEQNEPSSTILDGTITEPIESEKPTIVSTVRRSKKKE